MTNKLIAEVNPININAGTWEMKFCIRSQRNINNAIDTIKAKVLAIVTTETPGYVETIAEMVVPVRVDKIILGPIDNALLQPKNA